MKTALVFGASGISGWAFVNEILHDYPKKGIWGKAHALTNRPLPRESSYWPDDPRLNIVSGIDILGGSQDDLEKAIKEKIPDVNQVTHVFYMAYKQDNDADEESRVNLAMFSRAITAVDHLSPNLEFVVLQTGGKYYGCHLLENRPRDTFIPPLHEDTPRLKAPDDNLFYYGQLDWLKDYSADKKWNWNEPRPDLIIGFVPNQNFFCIATMMGVFLSLYRELYGPGAECPFPGTAKSWDALSIDTSSDMIARQTLHATFTPPWNQRKGEAFNVADQKEPSNWRVKWPLLCSYFGLKGVKLEQDNPLEIRAFIKKNIKTWEAMEKKYGLQTGHADSPRTAPGFEYLFMTLFDFDRQPDMTKIYSTGFTEERGPLQTWGWSWDKMKKAKIIPAEFK
ncbi:hypothetical protein F5X99DRAFT_386906 [Biscogniauxia marginata]|nr:hypothetical protein F5X99DRAFT_386906 [Biscogniauxia marginata]